MEHLATTYRSLGRPEDGSDCDRLALAAYRQAAATDDAEGLRARILLEDGR